MKPLSSLKSCLKKLHSNLILSRCCAFCGFWKISKSSFLCPHCEQEVLNLANLKLNKESHLPFKHFYLFRWENENYHGLKSSKNTNTYLVSNLIYTLKGGQMQTSFQWLSELFFLENKLGSLKKVIFIPAPSTHSVSDHAYEFAEALAQTFQAQFLDLFEKTTRSVQKSKSIFERKKIKLNIKNSYLKFYSNYLNSFSKIIFVDDLLTTGSTAEQAFKLINNDKKFMCLTLAFRPKYH